MAKESDPETTARRERFKAYCRKRGWVSDDGSKWRVVEIANAIKRKTNQVNNLFSDKFSFGPTVARAIEAELGLPKYYFDGAAAWPFSRDLQAAVEALDDDDLWHAENSLRAHLKLPPVAMPQGNSKRA